MNATHNNYWQGDKLNTVLRPFNHALFQKHGNKVLSGPFTGMEIPELGGWDEWVVFLKLFGEYERELHMPIEKAILRKPAVVVNVGCAEGYYAIGFGRRLPEAKIYAFDINNELLRLCRDYAGVNNTAGHLHTRSNGAFAPKDIQLFVFGHRLYFLDCEGAEFELLDPVAVPELLYSDLIVELHDVKDSSKTKELISKFKDTHDIELIPHEKRQLLSLIVEWKFNNTYDGVALGDMREDTGWLVAWARRDNVDASRCYASADRDAAA